MSNAFDFSEVPGPPAADIARAGDGILVYTKFLHALDLAPYRAARLLVAYIHEEDGLEAFGGYDRGVAAAEFDNALIPNDAMIYVNFGDTPNVAGHETEIKECSRGYGDATKLPIFGGYGSFLALLCAAAGSAKMQRRWGVETWYAGSVGDPDVNLTFWRNNRADLVQMANIASPVASCDLDIICTPTWATTSSDTIIKESAMEFLSARYPDGHVETDLYLGGVLVDTFTGAEGSGLGGGIAQSAINWNNFTKNNVEVKFVQSAYLEKLRAAQHVSVGSSSGPHTVTSTVTSVVT